MKNNKYTLDLKKNELGLTKLALQYLFMNADEARVCMPCQKELFNLVNRVTKIVDGKSLHEQMDEAKKGGDIKGGK